MSGKYTPIKATFDDVQPGDKIKRHGCVFYVVNKVVDKRGGYVEIRGVRQGTYDPIAQSQVWTKKDFNNRRYLRVQEPPVVTTVDETVVDREAENGTA